MKLTTTREEFERKSKEALDILHGMFGENIGFLVLLQSLDEANKHAFLATGSNLPQEAAVTMMRAHIEVMHSALAPKEGELQ